LNEIEVEYAEGSGGTPGVSIVDLQTPLPGTPFSMAVGPDRALWIPSLSTDPAYVGHLTRLTTFGERGGRDFPGEALGGPVNGPDGRLWFNSNGGPGTTGLIVRMSPLDFQRESFPIPSGNLAAELTLGPDGKLWFVEIEGNAGNASTAGAIAEFPADPASDIKAGPDGTLWYAAHHTTGSILLNPTTLAIQRFPVPADSASLAIGADGAIWFTAFDQNAVLRMTTSGATASFPFSKTTLPEAIILGVDGNIWVGGIDHVARV